MQPDYSLPLATSLKTATEAAHETASTSQGAGWLTRGELDKEEYIRFLMMLYHVYDALERALDKHASHPTLAPTYNPTLLARTPSLASDIATLLDTSEATWQADPLHKSLQASPPPSLTAYVERLRQLSDASDPSPLLAHSYVRYLGDLSGGQFIRRRITKAYGLEDDGLGTKFYDFNKLGGGGSANIGDMKKIKEWFRDGMNVGGGENQQQKKLIIDEANHAFDLNSGLFTALRAPSQAALLNSPATQPLLGQPSPLPSPAIKTSEMITAPIMVQHSEPAITEKTFSMASVLSFMLAVGLAHFLLVVGGFTGAKGLAKLELMSNWVYGLISPA